MPKTNEKVLDFNIFATRFSSLENQFNCEYISGNLRECVHYNSIQDVSITDLLGSNSLCGTYTFQQLRKAHGVS